MFQRLSSAWIQYSRTGPAALRAAPSAAEAPAPSPLRAATAGGTSTCFERFAMSTSWPSATMRCPARVQMNVAPVSPRKLRRSIGAGVIGRLLFDRDLHFHLRRVDRADEFIGARRFKGLLEVGVRD